jgi:hypothetical protein
MKLCVARSRRKQHVASIVIAKTGVGEFLAIDCSALLSLQKVDRRIFAALQARLASPAWMLANSTP